MFSNKITKAIKRDGRVVNFDRNKIAAAISKAAITVNENPVIGSKLADKVEINLFNKYKGRLPKVENIQDAVEEVLIKENYEKIAKAYILYRKKREELRELKKFYNIKTDDLKLSLNSIYVLQSRYLLRNEKGEIIETPAEMFRRAAKTVADAENKYKNNPHKYEEEFFEIMSKLEFLPNSPCLMNAGTKIQQLSGCFVFDIQDSLENIFDTLKTAALIQKTGGGTGFSFSKLRPRGDIVNTTKGISSGPVSFMSIYDKMTEVIKQGSKRRGANMGVLRVDHPDIVDFITCKNDPNAFTNFNISAAATDRFMEAVLRNKKYEIIDPKTKKIIKKINARNIFDMIVSNAWANGDPGLIFIDRINKTHNLNEEITATNPCGEQPLLPFESCVLGSINLTKFIINKKIGWERLKYVIHTSVRFLDNVIEANHYTVKEIENITKANRRIGLGIMGWADMLIMLEIPYNSNKALKLAEKLMKFINNEARKASEELGREKGDFPKFKESKLVKRLKHARNVAVTTIAPTGCVKYNTLISTDSGLKEIVNLGNLNGDKWQPINIKVSTDNKIKRATKFYINGKKPVIKVTTRCGYNLTATPNHKIKILDENGIYKWTSMKNIKLGTIVALKKNYLINNNFHKLKNPNRLHFNANKIRFPDKISPDFAELLGFYIADGYLKANGGLNIVVCDKDKDVKSHLKHLVKNLFNLDTKEAKHKGCYVLSWNSRELVRWFITNNLSKPKGNYGEGAEGAFIPEAILNSNKDCIFAFLRGLFEADGCVSKNSIVTLSTVSLILIEKLQITLLGLGIPTKIRILTRKSSGHKGKRKIYEIRPINREYTQIFKDKIGFVSMHKNNRLKNIIVKQARIDVLYNQKNNITFLQKNYNLPKSMRLALNTAKYYDRLTTNLIKKLISFHKDIRGTYIGKILEKDLFFDVVSIKGYTRCETYDLSVPQTNTYIANGFVSHNTISIIANSCSSGIEPLFAISYVREILEGTKFVETNRLFEDAARKRGFYNEYLINEISKVGSIQNLKEVPKDLKKIFVTALDIKPEWHVKMQAVFQKYTENGVSKTINLPENAAKEDVKKAYLLAYKLGCKGITVFRYGSKGGKQVLYFEEGYNKRIKAHSEFAGGCQAVECGN